MTGLRGHHPPKGLPYCRAERRNTEQGNCHSDPVIKKNGGLKGSEISFPNEYGSPKAATNLWIDDITN